MIFVSTNIFSQNLQQKKKVSLLLQPFAKPLPTTLLINNFFATTTTRPPFLSPNYYSMQLGFFCKQEIKFEKIIKFPFKFRLGSVADCDRMEGKQRVK